MKQTMEKLPMLSLLYYLSSIFNNYIFCVMKNNNYSPFRTLLDNHSNLVLVDLPARFTVNMFAERIHRDFPIEFSKAISQFRGEARLKEWLSQYYLPRKSFVKRLEIEIGHGRRISFASKSSFEKLWQKK